MEKIISLDHNITKLLVSDNDSATFIYFDGSNQRKIVVDRKDEDRLQKLSQFLSHPYNRVTDLYINDMRLEKKDIQYLIEALNSDTCKLIYIQMGSNVFIQEKHLKKLKYALYYKNNNKKIMKKTLEKKCAKILGRDFIFSLPLSIQSFLPRPPPSPPPPPKPGRRMKPRRRRGAQRISGVRFYGTHF